MRNPVLEMALLDVRPGMEAAFETAFADASRILATRPGYLSHHLVCSIEHAGRYLLLVNWESLEAHTVGFRGAAEYQQWKRLLHHFYNPFPTVEHFRSLSPR